MLGKGNNPEDATKLFNKALERLQSQQFDDAERYFDLSLYYELRPVTFFERAKLRLLRLRPTQTVTLPEVYSEAMRKIITGDEERERYEELISGWQGDAHDTPTHQIFGHPQAIQEDVFIECNDQIEVFNPKFQERFRKPSEDLLDPVNEWLLLLQIASDEEANFLWGDSGKLYFCIRRGDLAARNFAGVVLVGQCF